MSTVQARRERIEAMKDEIIRRGGIFYSSGLLSDEALEQFLQEILDCPLCSAEFRREH